MANKKKKQAESQRHRYRWIMIIFVMTVGISALFSFLSTWIMDDTGTMIAFLVLFVIIAIGVVFDMIGVSVTAADEKPFHSMAAKKKKGAREAIFLIKNADRVSSVCNDVIGDICGVISGSASAAIALRAFSSADALPKLLLSALVAGLTVGGKAFGKFYAIRNHTAMVHFTAMVLYYLKWAFLFHKKK